MAYEDLRKELNDTSESFEDGNYFIITIPDLDPNKTYELQFRWAYKDGTFGKAWSARKIITTPGESAPNTPGFIAGDVDVSQPEKIIITYRGVSDDATPVPITDIDRVDIYINGAPFDGSKPTDSFKEAGTKIIPAPAGTYTIVLYAISKLGAKSPVSSPVTKTVIAATVPVEPPTLPSGLSVAAAPFAVSVNWNGTYSAADFDGFKSIDIHVRGSDVGSTATSGFSTTTQVATLTVNSTTNRQNIGLDNLRQALSLANNQAAYTSPMFFYYIARNSNDQLYSVSGTPTYTRINSTSVNPTQANFVDLVNGVISIENLVAGNGQFSSWLRVGSAGGTRIELSGTNDFTNGGNTVQKGLVAYSSGSTEIFNLDIDAGTLAITGSGTFTGNLTIGSGNSVFKAEPSKGIWLGNSTWTTAGDAPFSVANNGNLYARTGTIGGWTLGSTFLQGNNIKLDNSQIIVGSTASSYLDIAPSSITHRNSNGTASNIFTLTLGASPQLTMSGTIALNSSSTIDGTAAGTVKSGAASGATALQEGNGVSKNGSNQINQILMNNGGIAISTASSGTRMQLNNSGLQLFNGLTRTVFLDGTTGSAEFTGKVTASTGAIGGWAVDSNGYLTNNSDTWLHPSTGYTTGGYSSTNFSIISSRGISGSTIQATSSSATSIQTSGGITLSGDISSTGDITTSGDISVTGTGVITSNGLVTALNGINVSAGGINVLSGNVFVKNTASTQYLESNRLRVVGDGATSGTGTIYADFLGTGTGTAIIQTSGGFLRVSSSSQRYKENIQAINKNGYLNLISQLRPVTFNYKEEFAPDDYMVVSSGLIAEEVDQVEELKTIVNYNKDNQPESISYDRLSALLVLAIQEIKDKLESIEQRLDVLEG